MRTSSLRRQEYAVQPKKPIRSLDMLPALQKEEASPRHPVRQLPGDPQKAACSTLAFNQSKPVHCEVA